MPTRASVLTAILALVATTATCDSRPVGGDPDGAVTDGTLPDARPLSCDPQPGALGCVEIVFPAQQIAFTQAEASAGIAFTWELVVPDALDEVQPRTQDLGCCAVGAGPLLARETVSGNAQHYCDCDHGLCDPAGCESPPLIALPAGRTPHTFLWPGVNWFGPSDTGAPYGPPFPRGTYVVRVRATGTWLPPGSPVRVGYDVEGSLEITLVDGCGDRPAAEAALWSCTGGVGEGGLCVDLTVDAAGQPIGWTSPDPLSPEETSCLDSALMGDCYPSLSGSTETLCIYGP